MEKTIAAHNAALTGRAEPAIKWEETVVEKINTPIQKAFNAVQDARVKVDTCAAAVRATKDAVEKRQAEFCDAYQAYEKAANEWLAIAGLKHRGPFVIQD